MKEPEVEAYKLELWQTKWLFGYTVLRSRLYDPAGRHLTPADDATVHVLILDRDRWYEAPMRWHRTWRSFYYFMRRPNVSRIIATASIHGFKVVEAHLAQPEVESLAAAAGEAMLES